MITPLMEKRIIKQGCSNRRNHSTSYREACKKIKTHRAVIDFDDKFVTATVKMEEENDTTTSI
jgi:hypothetical protein